MSVPSYFNTAFVRLEDLASTDVADVITDIGTILTATLPVGSRWTDLGGGEYQSPPQEPTGANHYMRVLVSRTSQFRMKFHTKNPTGTTIYDGEIDFTTAMAYRIWAGPYHLAVEFEYGAGTYEDAFASLIDPTPMALSSIGTYIICCTRRNSGGALIGNGYVDEGIMADYIGAVITNRIMANRTQNEAVEGYTSGGSKVALPVEVSIQPTSGQYYGVGKMYQIVMLPSSIAPKTIVTIPLDTGVTGDFEVCGKTYASTRPGRLAFRKA